MSNAVLGPAGVAGRYRTHRSQIMTLWVTRQGQSFVTSGDLQLCDIELINASVELVGEPGKGNVGSVSGYGSAGAAVEPFNGTMNLLHAVNDAGATSIVYNIEGENRILSKTHINHGFINVSIVGMTQGTQFRKDISVDGNDIELLIPTDNGLITQRLPNWPSTPLMLENVHLQQGLRVECAFAGNWPLSKRVARFVEDWADAPEVRAPGTEKRNEDGTVRYFVDNDEGQASTQECQVPANCVQFVKLVFKVSPRTEL